MSDALAVLWEYRATFASGFGVTISLLGVAMVIGTILGALLAMMARWEPLGLLRDLLNGLAFVSTAIPALVILFWVHYPAQALLDVRLSGFFSATITLVGLNALAVCRIILDQAESFPKQFLIAARVSGLRRSTILRRIYAPILLRAIVPRWIDQQVFILHCTLLASFISVEEIFRVAQRVNATVYEPVTIYTAMGLLYLALGGSALRASALLRRRFVRDWSER